jgi:hypothetical protein
MVVFPLKITSQTIKNVGHSELCPFHSLQSVEIPIKYLPIMWQ